jgi:hypothetical protein
MVFGHAGGQKLCSALPAAVADLAGIGGRDSGISPEISRAEIRDRPYMSEVASTGWLYSPAMRDSPSRAASRPLR